VRTPTPDMTLIFWLPCSSLAIRSASSIKSVPSPVFETFAHLGRAKDRRTIDMQFTDQNSSVDRQFGDECMRWTAFP